MSLVKQQFADRFDFIRLYRTSFHTSTEAKLYIKFVSCEELVLQDTNKTVPDSTTGNNVIQYPI